MFKLIPNFIARLVSRRVRELELEVKSLQDLVADGITGEYSSFRAWRNIALRALKKQHVWKFLLRERA